MKTKISVWLFIFFTICFLISCTPGPREVATKYLTALSLGQFHEASFYIQSDARPLFDEIQQLYPQLNPEEQKKLIVKNWIIDKVDQNDHQAVVYFSYNNGISHDQLWLDFTKEGWKVKHR